MVSDQREARLTREPPDPGPGAPPRNAADPVAGIASELAALAEYTTHLALAKLDRVGVRLRTFFLFLVLAFAGLLVAIGGTLFAFAMLLGGVAEGLGALLWNQRWLGGITAGLLGVVAVALVGWLMISRLNAALRRARMTKYERRKARQRIRFGTDADETATRPA